VPVSIWRLADRSYVQAASTDTGWVNNLRASGEAILSKGGWLEKVEATELAPETAGKIFQEALAPYRRSRLVRAVVGPTTRPPIGILHAFRLRVDTTLAEYVAYTRRHPVFELRAHS
jgi:hypothetical protein